MPIRTGTFEPNDPALGPKTFSRAQLACETYVRIASLVLTSLAPIVLLGWLFRIRTLTSPVVGAPHMAGSTAICFTLAGTSLLLLRRKSAAARVTAVVCALAVFIGGLGPACKYVFPWLGFSAPLALVRFGGSLPGQMAFATAFGFLLVGSSILCLAQRDHKFHLVSQLLALVALGVFLISLTGYAYQSSFLHTAAFYNWIAPGTVISFLVLGVAILCVEPAHGFMGVLVSRRQGGTVARRLLLPALALPVVFEWLKLLGQAYGLYDNQFGTALSITFNIVIISVLIWWTALSMNRYQGQLDGTFHELRDRERRFQSLVIASAQIVWTADPDGMASGDIPTWREVTGQSTAQIQGQGWLEAVHPDDRERTSALWGEAVAGLTPYVTEYRLRRKDGSWGHFAVRGVPIIDEGGVLREWVGTCTDISDRKEIERMKDELVSTVSHELRTPLASLRGFAELMLLRPYSEDKRRDFLTIIYNESKRLTSLINNFLDLQKMESAKQSYNFEVVHLGGLVRETVALFESSQKHHFRVQIPRALPPAMIDRDRIRQVLTNLISNATKYSPRGGEIGIKLQVKDQQICVAVSDQGIGIPGEDIPKLFAKFFRASNTAGLSIGGTGLGLALVKQIIELHRGRIWVESEAGKGSTFLFSLPALESDRQQSVPLTEESCDILIVEDDQNFCGLLVEHFESAGLLVKTTDCAEEALRMARFSPPRLMLVDIFLAGSMDGWELLVELKADEHLQTIPVCIVTVGDFNVRGLALAGADYVLKSSSADQLLRAVLRSASFSSAKRVLIVDDDGNFREFLRKLLSGEGDFLIEEASNGAEAIEKMAQTPPDLLLLDIFMPQMDGFEVLRWLRLNPATVNVEVLVITAKELTPAEKRHIRQRLASMVGKREANFEYFNHIVQRYFGRAADKEFAAKASARG